VRRGTTRTPSATTTLPLGRICFSNLRLRLPDTRVPFAYPGGTDQVAFEGELVVGEECRDVPAADAKEVIAGYTCANDITNRAVDNRVRRKAFDGSAPMGPCVVDPTVVASDASIELRVSGEVKQRSTLDRMVYSIGELVEEITAHLTLEPGDVVLTGTPAGIGPLADGDVVEIEIEGIGVLSHTVAQS
jgi:2-keto-4-pentenoate hydratase/2-oxohepta-3-ene-1,7-dioic acid hydratase in catechol pathway